MLLTHSACLFTQLFETLKFILVGLSGGLYPHTKWIYHFPHTSTVSRYSYTLRLSLKQSINYWVILPVLSIILYQMDVSLVLCLCSVFLETGPEKVVRIPTINIPGDFCIPLKVSILVLVNYGPCVFFLFCFSWFIYIFKILYIKFPKSYGF